MPPANYWSVEGFFPLTHTNALCAFYWGKQKKKVTNLILVQSEDAHHQHICRPAERSVLLPLQHIKEPKGALALLR